MLQNLQDMFYCYCEMFVNYERFLFYGEKLFGKELKNLNPPLNQHFSTVRFLESTLREYIKNTNCKRFRVK